ncbi:MAG: hypothetical protein PGN34_16340 [Methylobacterium frigidaeris]
MTLYYFHVEVDGKMFHDLKGRTIDDDADLIPHVQRLSVAFARRSLRGHRFINAIIHVVHETRACTLYFPVARFVGQPIAVPAPRPN